MNLYAYVGNDPVNATDPTGMCTEAAFCKSYAGPAAGTRVSDQPNSTTLESHQGHGANDGDTFLDRPYGSLIPTENPKTRYGWSRPDHAMDAAADEIRAVAREYYGREGTLDYSRMFPEAGAEVIELPNGRYTYTGIIVGRIDGRGNGSVKFSYGDPMVAARIHFHWSNSRPSNVDRQNAMAQYRLRGRDDRYIEAIGHFGGYRVFFYRGKQQ